MVASRIVPIGLYTRQTRPLLFNYGEHRESCSFPLDWCKKTSR